MLHLGSEFSTEERGVGDSGKGALAVSTVRVRVDTSGELSCLGSTSAFPLSIPISVIFFPSQFLFLRFPCFSGLDGGLGAHPSATA